MQFCLVWRNWGSQQSSVVNHQRGLNIFFLKAGAASHAGTNNAQNAHGRSKFLASSSMMVSRMWAKLGCSS